MKTTYALDTNTISYFLRGEGNVDEHFQKEIIDANNAYAVPHIVIYEIKRWLLDKPTKQNQAFAQEFDALFHCVKEAAEMPFQIWKKAAEIYISLKQKGQLIGDADILIAAYCLVNGYTLVTSNEDDFARIENLRIVNWYKKSEVRNNYAEEERDK